MQAQASAFAAYRGSRQGAGQSNQRARSVILFAKALTASDCCTSVSKGGRITIPRVAVEKNLPSVADRRHHEVVVLDVNDSEWTFVIKSWPNGGENKRVYVMEKTAGYMRRNKMTIGDVIAITRRPDGQLGVEHNSEAALHAVSQGRGRAAFAHMTPAETIAAQRCLRNAACSKPLGHAGFCDNGKASAMMRHNSLAGLAAAAEQASNASAGYGAGHNSPKTRPAADRASSSQLLQGTLVGKVLTKADVEHCRVVLPRLAMEANMPEVVDSATLHVDLEDEDGTCWPVTLSMSSCGAAKRMFILERIGMFLRQHGLKAGDCIAIKRLYDDSLNIVINPHDADGSQAASDSKDGEGAAPVEPAESGDAQRRQSVRRRRFKSGCEVNFARMLCGGIKSNGLADPFKNNEDDSFPDEQLPPPLQEHDPYEQPTRRGRQASHTLAPVPQQPAYNPYMHMQFPLGPHLYPSHALSNGHAAPAMPHDMLAQHDAGKLLGLSRAAAMSGEGLPDLPLPRPLSRTGASDTASKPEPSSALQSPTGDHDDAANADVPSSSQRPEAMHQAAASGSGPFMMHPAISGPVGTTGIMHRPMPYPNPTSVPSLFHPAVAHDAAALQALSGGFPGGNFAQGMPEGFPGLYYGAAAGAARLYAQHMAGPFGAAPGTSEAQGNPALYAPAGFNPFLQMPFAGFGHPQATAVAAGSDQAAGSAHAAESAKKRKTPSSSQKRAGAGKGHEEGQGQVLCRRATNRPPPQVPHGSLGKGGGTPKNLAPSHVLVAKVLTNSDTHGRIILPRVSVEANLTFLMGYRSYSLPVKDRAGRKWEFVIKSWANGTENRRVYVLEQTGEYLKVNRLGVGDAVGICTNEEGELVVECNSPEVRQATVRPTYGAAVVHHLALPPPGKAESFSNGAPGRCVRSPCCSKLAGHSGFCSGPRAASEGRGGPIHWAPQEPLQPEDQLRRTASAAARQEDEEDMDAAEEVGAEQMAVGTLLITHLTHQDLRSMEVLLPREAVEANIPPALMQPLIKFQVVDNGGQQHKVLLRNCVHGQEGMYLLDRLGPVLERAGARGGDMLMLSRQENGPVTVHLEAMNYSQHSTRAGADALAAPQSRAHRPVSHPHHSKGAQAAGEWSDEYETGSESEQEEADEAMLHSSEPDQTAVPDVDDAARYRSSSLGKRKASSLEGSASLKRQLPAQQVHVTCASSSGLFDLRTGHIALRAAQNGQIVNLELSPAEFEQHVLGRQQDWRASLLVEVEEQRQQGCIMAVPLGQWLQQQGIQLDEQGCAIGLAHLATEPQPHLPARHASTAGARETELKGFGRARSLPLARAQQTNQIARFASKPVPRAYIPKRARSRSTVGVPLTTQDSLAAEALLSLCPSGPREMPQGRVGMSEPAPSSSAENAGQRTGSAQISSPGSRAQGSLHTQRTSSIEVALVDSRGYGGVASMDPAGSAVLDQILHHSATAPDTMAIS